MTAKAVPITAVIVWSSREGPDIPSAHSYRGDINMANGVVVRNQPIGRPGHEEWHPDQLVYPLTIGSRIHGDEIGGVYQWQYAEKPVIGDCEDIPPGTPGAAMVPGLVGGETPTPGGVVSQARTAFGSTRRSLAVRLLLETNETERAALRRFLLEGA